MAPVPGAKSFSHIDWLGPRHFAHPCFACNLHAPSRKMPSALFGYLGQRLFSKVDAFVTYDGYKQIQPVLDRMVEQQSRESIRVSKVEVVIARRRR